VERFMTGDNDFSQFVPSAQVGASFLLTPTNVFRTSLGQGYRMPSLLERYVEAEIFNIDAGILGNFPINAIPNLGILPEYGWNYELGYKKLFKTNRLKGYLDAAFFVMQYRNMAELTLDVHLTEEELQNATLGVIRENIGFKYINKTFGRIAGYEVGAHLDGNAGRVPFRLWGGYTYTYPGDMDSIRANGQNFWNNWLTAMHAPDSILNTIMLYRSLHTARIDVEFELFKRLTLGGVVTFNGFMHNIDAVFEGKGRWGELIELLNGGALIPGTNEFRAGQVGGDWVFDVRANVLIAEGHRLHFIVTNVTNREYALRVGRMNPLRTFNIKYQMTF
jgi:outer membrane receptor protein involved in Fe transport